MNAYSESACYDCQTTPGLPGVFISADAQARNTISADCAISTHEWVQEKNAPRIEQSTNEVWRPVPGHDGYEASTWGRIRSVDRVLELMGRWGPMTRFHRGKILRLKRKPNGWGLTYLCFYAGGGSYPQVNRAVCWTFHGTPPSQEHEAAHLDGRPENNRPENLAWKTPKENAADKVRHGTATIGAKNARARLNEAIVADIIGRYAAGEKSLNLAVEHHVSVSNIRAVVRGDTWTHVQSAQRESAKSRCRENMLEASRRTNAQRALYAQH